MPLLWLSLAFIAGIVIADFTSLPTSSWLILAGVTLAVTCLNFIIRRARVRRGYAPSTSTSLIFLLPLLLFFLILGGLRYEVSLPDLKDPSFIASHNDSGQRVSVIGVVDSFPDKRDRYLSLKIQTEDIRPYGTTTQHQPVHGVLLTRLDPEMRFRYGDRLLLHGYVETPPVSTISGGTGSEVFSYRKYLARQGIYSYMGSARAILIESDQGSLFWSAIYKIKGKALQTVYQLWPDPEASLFAGILLGVESGIPEPVADAFQETGTSHIIAISGFNMAIVAGLFILLFGRLLGPRKGALTALIGLGLYTVLVGADAAVVRAAIMAGFALFASLVGRRQEALLTLAFTAALMALFNPQVLWDLGFQLSFAATIGLIMFAKPMQDGFENLLSRHVDQQTAKKVAIPVGEYLLFTIAAQITTIPIIAYYFGNVSWVSFLANPAILPAQPPIMTLGGLAVVFGMIWPPLGEISAPLAWPFVVYTIRAVEFFADFRGGAIQLGGFSLMWVVLFFVLLFSLTFGRSQIHAWLISRKENLYVGIGIPVITFLGISAVIIWRLVFNAPDGVLHLTLLDVGSGDAILVQTPEGQSVLINGGPSGTLLSNGLGRRLPPFQKDLDWLVVASPKGDQISGISQVLRRFPPDNVIWAGLPSIDRVADYLREELTNFDIEPVLAQPGQILDLGTGAKLQVLAVSQRGSILLLEWDRFRALLPLGADLECQEAFRMGKDIGEVGVLLLADQGYAPLNSPEWITNLRPQLVLLSVGSDNRDGRPDIETLDALGGYSLLRTDQHGWIEVSTDGEQMWVEVEK